MRQPPARTGRRSAEPGASARSVEPERDRPELTLSRTTVVGYDGSAGARGAVIQAAQRAGERGHVFVVYAYDSPPGHLGHPYYDQRLIEARQRGAAALTELLREPREDLPRTDYVEELLGGPPAEAINTVARTRNADAILVGAPTVRGRGRRARGSVSHKLIQMADRPVLVVPTQPH